MTSFMQYEFCELCRRNHNKGKKHIFSKTHICALNSILQKYGKRIKHANDEIGNPVVHNSTWEKGANFWCYFCRQEVNKHCVQDETTVENGGLFQHLCSKEHAENTKKFFFLHRINRDKQDQFLLSEEDFTRFWSAALRNIRYYQEAQFMKCQKEAAKIRNQENTREWITNSQRQMVGEPRYNKQWKERLRPSGDKGDNYRGFYTAEAYGAGLSCVRLPKDVPEKGNIYTESVPPWLQNDTEETSSQSVTPAVIGPTMEDLNKHVQMDKKRKLPPNRVGAKYDRSGGTADSWLPLFGRVWSKNSRTHARKTKFPIGSHRPVDVNTSYANSTQSSQARFNTTPNTEGTYTLEHNNSAEFINNSHSLSTSKVWDGMGSNWQNNAAASVTAPFSYFGSGTLSQEPSSTSCLKNDTYSSPGGPFTLDNAAGYKRKLPFTADSNSQKKRIHIADNLL